MAGTLRRIPIQILAVFAVCIAAVFNDPCPFPVNVTQFRTSAANLRQPPGCRCTPVTHEIVCSGLDAVPDFPATADVDGVYRMIYLHRQSISELRPYAFHHLPSLRKIVLDFNVLGDHISESAFHLVKPTTLRELSLAGCRIRTLPPRLLSGMRELRRLALWANELRHIPTGFFDDTDQLVDLSLWSNHIDRITVDTFAPAIDTRLSPIRWLDLDRNRIAAVGRGIFSRLTDLESLRLGRNRINSVPAETFVGLSRLRSLVIDNNGLGFLYARAFDGLDSLLSLSLNDNAITFLPDGVFSPLGRLVDLYLQNNRLEYIWSQTFRGLRSLRRLNLSGNRLSNLPDDVFSHSPLLSSLGLDDNQFRTLRRCLLPPAAGPRTVRHRPSRSRRTLSVIGNADLQCDCKLAWLAAQISEGSTTVWGSCDVQLETTEPPTAAIDDKRSPVISVVMKQYFSVCPPASTDCTT